MSLDFTHAQPTSLERVIAVSNPWRAAAKGATRHSLVGWRQ